MSTAISTEGSTRAVVIGAGPVGLWLAAELALAGVATTILEQRAAPASESRALGVMPRTLEVLALRGTAEELVERGRAVPAWHFGLLETPLDFRNLDTPYPFMLSVPQTVVEAVLEDRALALGVEVLRETTFLGVRQEPDHVTIEFARDGHTDVVEAGLLIGCDGARSSVRAAAGIDFDGLPSTHWGFLADVHLDQPPAPGLRIWSPEGALIVVPLPGGIYRVTGWDPKHQDRDYNLDLESIRTLTQTMTGTDFGMHDPTWLSRFGDANRLAATYRQDRILLAGDAAHTHWPTGGLGLNAGLQDAMSLGWRAGRLLRTGEDPATLDAYSLERRAYGQSLRVSTLAQGALITAQTASQLALRTVVNELLSTPDGNRRIAEDVSGLAFSYPGEQDDPLSGTRFPLSSQGTAQTYVELFHSGEPVAFIAQHRSVPDRISELSSAATGELPAAFAGEKNVDAVLVRPDGHIAWSIPVDSPERAEV